MSKFSKYIHKTVYKNISAPLDDEKEEVKPKRSAPKHPSASPKIVELELSDSEEILDSEPDESGQEDEIEEEKDSVHSLNNIHGTFERALRTATFDDFWDSKPQGFLK